MDLVVIGCRLLGPLCTICPQAFGAAGGGEAPSSHQASDSLHHLSTWCRGTICPHTKHLVAEPPNRLLVIWCRRGLPPSPRHLPCHSYSLNFLNLTNQMPTDCAGFFWQHFNASFFFSLTAVGLICIFCALLRFYLAIHSIPHFYSILPSTK